MAAKHFGEFELLDYSESRASTRVYFGPLTALNLAGFLTQFGNLRTAIDAITLGTISRERWVGDSDTLSNIPPNDPNAQRELFWLVSYEDANSGRKYTLQIPAPDTAKLIPGTDEADYADTDIAAYITAFQAIGRSPVDPEAGVLVLGIQLRGRKR